MNELPVPLHSKGVWVPGMSQFVRKLTPFSELFLLVPLASRLRYCRHLSSSTPSTSSRIAGLRTLHSLYEKGYTAMSEGGMLVFLIAVCPLLNSVRRTCSKDEKQCFWLVPLDSPCSSQFTVPKLRCSRVQENNAVYSIHLISLNTCPMSHHCLVSASSSSNLSSSFLRNSHGWLVNSLSLKSRSMRIVDDPKLLDSCTYALKGVSPPVGGVAMSTMTASKPYQDMRLAAWEKGAVCNESNVDRYVASSSNCEAMFICDIFILLTLCIRKRLRRTVLEPVKLLVFGMHTQSPKSFYRDVMNKKRYLILCCSTTLEII